MVERLGSTNKPYTFVDICSLMLERRKLVLFDLDTTFFKIAFSRLKHQNRVAVYELKKNDPLQDLYGHPVSMLGLITNTTKTF